MTDSGGMRRIPVNLRLPLIIVACGLVVALGFAAATMLPGNGASATADSLLTSVRTVKGHRVTITKLVHVPARTIRRNGRTVTLPAHTQVSRQTVIVPGGTHTVPVAGPTRTVTGPGGTTTVVSTAPGGTTTIAGPTTTVVSTQTGPTTTVVQTVTGPGQTQTVTETATSTVTLTVTAPPPPPST